MIASLALLKGSELENLPKELTVILFSVSGLEAHGSHLPLGTKLIQVENETLALANLLQARMPHFHFLIMPAIPLMVDGYTSKTSFTVRAHVVRDALVDQCAALERLGFSQFLALSSHLTPQHLSAIEDAARIVSRRKLIKGTKSIFISVNSANVNSSEVWNSPMVAIPSEHAGAADTAWLLSLDSKFVAPDYQNLPAIEKPKAGFSHSIAYFKHQVDGYWGNPQEAALIQAQEASKRQAELELLVPKIQIVLEQQKGQSLFQSGYRYFPLNGSFFKSYFLATLFFLMMLILVMMNLKEAFNAD